MYYSNAWIESTSHFHKDDTFPRTWRFHNPGWDEYSHNKRLSVHDRTFAMNRQNQQLTRDCVKWDDSWVVRTALHKCTDYFMRACLCWQTINCISLPMLWLPRSCFRALLPRVAFADKLCLIKRINPVSGRISIARMLRAESMLWDVGARITVCKSLCAFAWLGQRFVAHNWICCRLASAFASGSASCSRPV